MQVVNRGGKTFKLVRDTPVCWLDLDDGSEGPYSEKERADSAESARVCRAFAEEFRNKRGEADPHAEPTYDEQENVGPKTAGAPDLERIPLAALREKLHINPDLPPEQREELANLAYEYQEAFALDGKIGKVKGSNFKIELREGSRPVQTRPYPGNPKKRREIDEVLDKWLIEDIIEPSRSPWSASVVVVYRNLKPRVCIDYRRINAMTIPDNFILAKRDDIFQALAGKQWFSTLDCLSGFQQIVVDPASRPYTGFQCHRGRFHFKRLPFGLMNGPAEFQRVMQEVLAELLWLCVLVYIDDVVVFSMTFGGHLHDLQRTLKNIVAWGLVLSPAKCFLGFRSLKLLGQNVSRLGVSTIEQKIEAIMKTPPPKDVPSLRSFLGMMNFYANFIPFYAWIAKPLFLRLKKGAEWVWGEKEHLAWVGTRQALSEAPVLAHPIENRPYRLYTDASNVGGSAILQQIQPIRVGDLQDTRVHGYLRGCLEQQTIPKLLFKRLTPGEELPEPVPLVEPLDENIVQVERIIAVYSRTWNVHELGLSTTEMEALALKDGLIKFQGILEGEQITAITDHEALKWATHGFETANRKLQAWNTTFAAFGVDVVYQPGKLNGNADYLSRFFPTESVVWPDTTLPPRLDALLKDVEVIDLHVKEEEAEKDRSFNPDVERVLEAHRLPSPFGARRATSQEDEVLARTVVESPESLLVTSRTQKKQSSRRRPPVISKGSVEPVLDPFGDVQEGSPRLFIDPELKDRLVAESRIDPWTRRRLEQLEDLDSDRTHDLLRDEAGLLYIRWKGLKLCIPKGCQTNVLRTVHENPYLGAHAGVGRTLSLLADGFFWPGMEEATIEFIKSCPGCQGAKNDTRAKAGAMKPLELPSYPGDAYSLDFVVALPIMTFQGQEVDSVLVVVERMTRLAIFIPTRTTVTALEVASLLIDHVFTRFGFPLKLIGDRDPRWTSLPFQEVAKALGVKLALSTAHHPQTDGMTEALNKWMEIALRMYTSTGGPNWALRLAGLAFAYNLLKHSSTRKSPFELMHGYSPRNPLQQHLESPLYGYLDRESADFTDLIEANREIASMSATLAQGHQARYYNRGRREEVFQEGDKVLLQPFWTEIQSEEKLADRWTGPFEVTEVVSPLAYRLALGGQFSRMHPVISIAHLKRFYEPNDGRPLRTPARPDQLPQEFEVEAIQWHRYKKQGGRRVPEFFIKWAGYGDEERTWQRRHHLKNASKILDEYEASETHALAEKAADEDRRAKRDRGSARPARRRGAPPLAPDRRQSDDAVSEPEEGQERPRTRSQGRR